jgi:hypothetical protein
MEIITAQFADIETAYRRERLIRDVQQHSAATSAWRRRRQRVRHAASVARHLRAA